MEFNLFSQIFLIASALYLGVTYWLNSRQISATQASFSQVPEQFSQKITLESHQKAANYTQAKLRFSFKETILGFLLLLIWTFGGGLSWLDGVWQSLTNDSFYQGIGLMISFMLIAGLLDLPSSWYRTFVLEKKFDFNKMTVKLFVTDNLKSLALTLIFGTPLIALILYLMSVSGQFWWLFVWGLLVSISLLMLWLYPSYIAPIFNKFTPLPDQELANKITALLKQAGFSSNGIFVMDGSKRSSHGNAYFTGLGKQKRIVFFDTLLKGLSHNEVLAVLGHELGHFHHKHIRTQMINSFSILLVSLAILGFLIEQPWFYLGLGVTQQSSALALLLFLLVMPIFTFFTQPLASILSRKHEYEADAFAAKHTNAQDLITALVGLYRDNANTLTPDKYYSLFYDSHPSASLRIKHLTALKG